MFSLNRVITGGNHAMLNSFAYLNLCNFNTVRVSVLIVQLFIKAVISKCVSYSAVLATSTTKVTKPQIILNS